MTTQLVTLVVAVLTCSTALLVGYQQRRQMRQIELFREQPELGLVPPPSPPMKFLKGTWTKFTDPKKNYALLLAILPIGLSLWNRHSPSDLAAAWIAFAFANLIYLLMLKEEKRALDLWEMDHRMWRVQRDITELQRDSIKTLAAQCESLEQRIETIVRRLPPAPPEENNARKAVE